MSRHVVSTVALLACIGAPRAASAQDEAHPPEGEAGAVVVGQTEGAALSTSGARSTVSRDDLERRLPRSAPDALRYEPGVFVQQTAHGQGSAYLRGLTGQQTLMMFDGVRLNNALYRQGPNQYFFTLDARTIDRIDVERGGASTRWGSDALGGVINAQPVVPTRLPQDAASRVQPGVSARGTTADSERGGRVQLDAAYRWEDGTEVGFVGGVGRRSVGALRGRPVLNPDDSPVGPLPWVPRYEEYQPTVPLEAQLDKLRTQHGTGFGEVTADGRVEVRPSARARYALAAYTYRQTDVPRTDQCPAPTAPFDECLTFEEQFRDLVYWTFEERQLGGLAANLRATFSWQRQHERRRLDLTSANKVGRGVNDVDTYGATAVGRTRALHLGDDVRASLEYGVDTYRDLVESTAEHGYVDTGDSVVESRGLYLDGSSYLTGGAFADATVALTQRWTVRGGVRAAWVTADAPADPESETRGVDRAWTPVVGRAGLEFAPLDALRLFVNYDQAFRAPNLDDLTSRQMTGPGFQFENPDLRPETSETWELGVRHRSAWLMADAWLFDTRLSDAMVRVYKTADECPPNARGCAGAWSRLKLQNAPAESELRGAEASLKATLPAHLSLRSTVSYVWTEGPRVGVIGWGGGDRRLGDRVPLAKTPPLNGTSELDFTHPSGLTLGAALQWATTQDRLAVADYADARIPKYGTPGFAVLHLRGAYRVRDAFALSAVLENALDSAWRYHGSSINGPERGLVVQGELTRVF